MQSIHRIPGKICVFFLAAGILISCRKERSEPGNPPPVEVEKNLTVNLRNSIISVAEIDSASVILKKQGSNNPMFKRLIKGTDLLQTEVDGLRAGQWTAELDLYTKKLPDGKSYQYIVTKPFTVVGAGASVEINGPTAQSDNGWKTRMVFSTSDNDIVALVPTDVTDPYFEIRTKGFQWNDFSVERTAVHGNAVVSNKLWVCNGDCPGNDRLVFNRDYFVPFTEKIKAAPWTHSEINISVGNRQNHQYNDFSFIWQK